MLSPFHHNQQPCRINGRRRLVSAYFSAYRRRSLAFSARKFNTFLLDFWQLQTKLWKLEKSYQSCGVKFSRNISISSDITLGKLYRPWNPNVSNSELFISYENLPTTSSANFILRSCSSRFLKNGKLPHLQVCLNQTEANSR